MKKEIIYIIFGLLFSQNLFAQLISIDLPITQYSNVEISSNDVLRFSLLSVASEDVKGRLELEVSQDGRLLATLNTSIFNIKPGNNTSESVLRQSPLTPIFITDGFENIADRSFKFPAGRFNVCLRVLTTENAELDKKCISLEVLNMHQLLLIYPFNGEAIDDQYPGFSWTPLFSDQGRITYRTVWLESDKEEFAETSVQSALPFHIEEGQTNNIFPYGINQPKLKRDKYYFWKVEAFLNNKLLAQSELWQFHFERPSKRSRMSATSYLNTKEDDSSSTYFFKGDNLGLFVDNFEGSSDLRFSIRNAQNTVVMTEQMVEVDPLKHGRNYYSIDVSNYIQPDETHTIEINKKRNKSKKFKLVRYQ